MYEAVFALQEPVWKLLWRDVAILNALMSVSAKTWVDGLRLGVWRV